MEKLFASTSLLLREPLDTLEVTLRQGCLEQENQTILPVLLSAE